MHLFANKIFFIKQRAGSLKSLPVFYLINVKNKTQAQLEKAAIYNPRCLNRKGRSKPFYAMIEINK